MTIFGWDQSHFDGPGIGGAVAEGISFITHKAGGDRDDPELGAWWSGVRGLDPAKVLLGAYWVLLPGSPTARADAFISRLDGQCPGWRLRPFILQLDCEKWNGDQGTVPGKADIQTFCARLRGHAPKLRPIVYAPSWVYGDSLTGLGYPLWASRYVTGTGGFKSLYPGDNSSKWNSYSGQVPAILQYTSSATIGGQTTCDANAYRGTLAQLQALVAPGWEADMPLTNADADVILQRDAIQNPSQRADAATNPTTTVSWALADTWAQVYGLRDQVAALGKSLTAAITALAGKDQVDEQALAAALAPGVAAAVLSGLPTGGDPVSQDEVTAAVKAAFHDAFAS
jgi:hypothetical protein